MDSISNFQRVTWFEKRPSFQRHRKNSLFDTIQMEQLLKHRKASRSTVFASKHGSSPLRFRRETKVGFQRVSVPARYGRFEFYNVVYFTVMFPTLDRPPANSVSTEPFGSFVCRCNDANILSDFISADRTDSGCRYVVVSPF